MAYRVVEADSCEDAARARGADVSRHDCAYAAVEVFRRALAANDDRVWRWYLVDDSGTVLFAPSDLDAISAMASDQPV